MTIFPSEMLELITLLMQQLDRAQELAALRAVDAKCEALDRVDSHEHVHHGVFFREQAVKESSARRERDITKMQGEFEEAQRQISRLKQKLRDAPDLVPIG